MPYNAVFIIKAVIRAGIVRTLQKLIHLVLVKIYEADIAVIIIIIDIICTGLTVRSFLSAHVRYPP